MMQYHQAGRRGHGLVPLSFNLNSEAPSQKTRTEERKSVLRAHSVEDRLSAALSSKSLF